MKGQPTAKPSLEAEMPLHSPRLFPQVLQGATKDRTDWQSWQISPGNYQVKEVDSDILQQKHKRLTRKLYEEQRNV